MQRKQRRLQRKTHEHHRQRRRHRGRRRGPDHAREIQTAQLQIDQPHAQQEQERAKDAGIDIVQPRGQGLAPPAQHRQADGGQGDDLDHDIEVEEVGPQIDPVQPAEQQEPERPEILALARIAFLREGVDRADADQKSDQPGQGKHRHRQPVGAQLDPQRRAPAAQRHRHRAKRGHLIGHHQHAKRRGRDRGQTKARRRARQDEGRDRAKEGQHDGQGQPVRCGHRRPPDRAGVGSAQGLRRSR